MNNKKLFALTLFVSASSACFADTIDVSDVVTFINGLVAPVTAVGTAALIVIATAAGLKHIRRAV